METHNVLYKDLDITIQINDLRANSYIEWTLDGVKTIYEAKGIEVNKMSKEANTNFAKILKNLSGSIIKSSSGKIPNVLPFEYFAYAVIDIPMYEAIDKKMINGLLMTFYDFYVFSPDGTYIEPLDFELSAGEGSFTIDYIVGQYPDKKFCYRKNGVGLWSDWKTGTFQDGLESGAMYEVKATSSGTVLNYDPVHQIVVS